MRDSREIPSEVMMVEVARKLETLVPEGNLVHPVLAYVGESSGETSIPLLKLKQTGDAPSVITIGTVHQGARPTRWRRRTGLAGTLWDHDISETAVPQYAFVG